MAAGLIRTEGHQTGIWDINDPIERRIARIYADSSPIKFSDFYGKSFQQDFMFGGSGAANYCSNPAIGYLNDYTTYLVSGDTFQVVIAFIGSWAPINGQYPAIQVHCTYGVSQYFDIGSTTGGKSAHMTFRYDGGNVITLSGYYTGKSTSFPCATVYVLSLSFPDPQNIGSGYTNTGIDYSNYIAANPQTHNFINHWVAPPEPDPGPPGSDQTSCFLMGSPVVMADGTIKMIEDITIGEWVRGAFGEHNQVLALDRPLLGNRTMYNINGEHQTTAEHNHLTESGLFGCVSLAESQNEKLWTHQEVITDQGVEEWFFSGIQDTSLITQFELGNRLKTTDGYKSLDSMEPLTLAPETQLYNLVLSGSHTYYVQGYCVTGFGHDYDFDYRTWQSKGTSWSADDYRNPKE